MNFHAGTIEQLGFHPDAVRSLVDAAVNDPEVRAALYADPARVAQEFGLSEDQGQALALIRNSLVSAMGEEQVKALDGALLTRMRLYGPGEPPCSPNVPQRCRPNGCNPGCNPDAMR